MLITNQARKSILIGRQNHWRFKVVGSGDLPEVPTYKENWWFEPTTTPDMGRERIEALRASGVQIKGILIAHEAPKLLPAPKAEPKPEPKQDFKISPIVSQITEFLLAFLLLFVQVILIDPALIVVLDDGTWLEVMTWYE